MRSSLNTARFLLMAALLSVVSTGCTTTKGSYQMTSMPSNDALLTKYSDVAVEVSCAKGVALSQPDIDRIRNLIVENIVTEYPNRFKSINPATPGANALKAGVNITKYDEGSVYARAMLVGLAQIHIDAAVVLSDYNTGEKIAAAEVTKTFDWGRYYHGSTQIKDLENGFAKAVASSICGKK
jgi:hypothetical protein